MPWLTLIGLGAFHGINPAMGWLFAVAIGLQERSRWALARSLVPIAIGHELSVAVIVVFIESAGALAAPKLVAGLGAIVLVAFGVWRLVTRRHLRWVGMRLSVWELGLWSFLMSSAHGAGLMLFPVLVDPSTGRAAAPGHDLALLTTGQRLRVDLLHGMAAAGIHSAAMVVVMGVVAFVVYEFIGVDMLRRAWFNLDRVWAFALIGAGVVTLFS